MNDDVSDPQGGAGSTGRRRLPTPVRVLLWVILIVVAVVVLFTWVFPWVESIQQDPTLGAVAAAPVPSGPSVAPTG